MLVAEPLAERQDARSTMDEDAPPEALAQLIDRLQQRLGAGAVRSLPRYQSHIPERAVRTCAASPSPRSSRKVPPPPCGEGSGVGVAQEGSLSHETYP